MQQSELHKKLRIVNALNLGESACIVFSLAFGIQSHYHRFRLNVAYIGIVPIDYIPSPKGFGNIFPFLEYNSKNKPVFNSFVQRFTRFGRDLE